MAIEHTTAAHPRAPNDDVHPVATRRGPIGGIAVLAVGASALTAGAASAIAATTAPVDDPHVELAKRLAAANRAYEVAVTANPHGNPTVVRACHAISDVEDAIMEAEAVTLPGLLLKLDVYAGDILGADPAKDDRDDWMLRRILEDVRAMAVRA